MLNVFLYIHIIYYIYTFIFETLGDFFRIRVIELEHIEQTTQLHLFLPLLKSRSTPRSIGMILEKLCLKINSVNVCRYVNVFFFFYILM